MLRDERLEKIVAYIDQNRFATLAQLTESFGISRATIRRDLAILSDSRRVVLTRGGAASATRGTTFELPFHEKRQQNQDEKIRIGAAACAHVNAGETIMIDSGTTCNEMVPFLQNQTNVSVATNDLLIAVGLAACPNIQTMIVGGGIRRGFYTATGYYAETQIREFHFDKAFLSVDALDLRHGCMITNADEVAVKRAILAAAREVVVLCDHTKFDTTAFVSICKLERITRIITGREISPDHVRAFTDAGITLVIV